MNYKKVIQISIPVYIVISALLITVTQFESFNRVVVTSVFSVMVFAAVMMIMFQFRSCPELYECIDIYERMEGDPVILPKTDDGKKRIRRSREIATLLGICMPVLLSGLTIFIANFSETLNIRYYEYVSVYVNYSVPFFASLVLLYLRR
jgi:hypothetical protein